MMARATPLADTPAGQPYVVASQHFAPVPSAGWPLEFIGAKAEALMILEPDWTPPFAVLTDRARQDLEGETKGPGWLATAFEREDLGRVLAELVEVEKVIVRSSAVHERLDLRGHLCSDQSPSDLQSIEATVERVWEANAGIIGRRATGHGNQGLALVIQQFVAPVLAGHAANERRVSERHDSWLVEELRPDGALEKDYRVAGKPHRIEGTESDLLQCGDRSKLKNTFRDLAAATSRLGRGRRHLEWVWDGSRVWVVQCDTERSQPGEPPNSRWEVSVSEDVQGLSSFVNALDATGSWQKTECVKTFASCGMATATLHVLEDSDTIAALMRGDVPDALATDLALLAKAPIVVRTDVAESASKIGGLLLPHTDARSDPAEVGTFMKETCQALAEQGVSPEGVCFLAHRFIPAKAGSYSVARPKVARVRVDATWGVPDGLLYLPHDSFEVDLADPAAMWMKKRCKSHYVDFESDGSFFEKTAGTPWDWQQCVSGKDLHTIAQQSLDLANAVDSPVEVMHFVDLPDETGLPRVLPWFLRPTHAALDPEAAPRVDPGRVEVRSLADVDDLASRLRESLEGISGIAIQADCEHVHSDKFVMAVAAVAQDFRLPVDLRGSVLGHAYYVLNSQGVRARCIDLARPPGSANIQSFDKLVRDAIPRRIHGGGERSVVEQVEGIELVELLRTKAVEEALELVKANNPDEMLEEAADLVEVLRALCDQMGISFEHLLGAADAKKSTRGGFDTGTVLRGTYVPSPIERPNAGSLFSSAPALPPPSSFEPGVAEFEEDGELVHEIRIPRVPPRFRQPVRLEGGDGPTRWEAIVFADVDEVRIRLGRPRARPSLDQLQLPYPEDPS